MCRGTSTAATTPSGGLAMSSSPNGGPGTMVPSQWPRTHFKTALEVLGDVYQAMELYGTMIKMILKYIQMIEGSSLIIIYRNILGEIEVKLEALL